jgi:hypothetical protein
MYRHYLYSLAEPGWDMNELINKDISSSSFSLAAGDLLSSSLPAAATNLRPGPLA